MKTEDLKSQGLTDEQINFVMAEFGKEVNPLKGDLENYKRQYNTAKEALDALKGVDVDSLNGEIATLKEELEKAETKYKEDLEERDYRERLNTIGAEMKAIDVKALEAYLDHGKLKSSKNQAEDIKAAIAELKESKSFLFDAETTVPTVVGSTSGPANVGSETKTEAANSALRKLFRRD